MMPQQTLTMPPERGGSPLFSMRFTTFAVGTVFLPLLSFIFCIFWSLLFDFIETTNTHCGVPNYLPSISAAIGGVTPQRYIWRFCIGLHSAPRLLVAVAYLKFYQGFGGSYWQTCINFIFNVLEIVGLLLLTYISSNENHDIHQLCFAIFMTFSLGYMIMTILIWKKSKKYVSVEERRSYNWKKRLFCFYLFTFSVAIMCYIRHNTYCEPGVYTMFAFMEYLVVFSNMGFHMTAWWDFGNKELLICSPQDDKHF